MEAPHHDAERKMIAQLSAEDHLSHCVVHYNDGGRIEGSSIAGCDDLVEKALGPDSKQTPKPPLWFDKDLLGVRALFATLTIPLPATKGPSVESTR